VPVVIKIAPAPVSGDGVDGLTLAIHVGGSTGTVTEEHQFLTRDVTPTPALSSGTFGTAQWTSSQHYRPQDDVWVTVVAAPVGWSYPEYAYQALSPADGQPLIAVVLPTNDGLVGPGADPGACPTGTDRGTAYNDLTNGAISARFCGAGYSPSRVTVSYHKTGGAPVRVRLGWEYVDSSGGSVGDRFWGYPVSLSVGDTMNFTFTNPGTQVGRCMRGFLTDMASGSTYATHTLC
jgi:hypothetical protein